ncbi:MAG: hypothetical protein QOG75_1287 [Mycobacterium sp.]|nr:hypothetical protein [Mycobacterium sp.]
MRLSPRSDRTSSDSGRLNPFVDIVPRPPPMSVTEPDVVWARRRHSALSLGGPVVERRDGHTGDVMDFFGREHLTTVGQGFRHGNSLMFEGWGRSVRSWLNGMTQL